MTVEHLRGTMVFYHPSLRSLRDSAAAGCDMCRMFWVSIQQRYEREDIDAVLSGKAIEIEGGQPLYDERVWLLGEFRDRGRSHSKYNESTWGSAVWVYCGYTEDPDMSVKPGVLQSRVAVFADPGTPAAAIFKERYFMADRNPDGHVEFARGLLARCWSSHPECGPTNTDPPPEMPTRVLDIGHSPGSTKLVLARENGLREPYLALSYCWGQGVHHATELRDNNYTCLLESIDEMALTAAHRDCIAISRKLGIRYIWIDSLCIIQGNPTDWEHESKMMAEVYGNATLTVIAGRTGDSRLGFLTSHMKQEEPPCALPLGQKDEDGTDTGDVFLCLPRRMLRGVINTRGWCFQEMVLSRRKLTYEVDQVCFSCQRLERAEDGNTMVHNSYQLRSRLFRALPSSVVDVENLEVEREQLRTQMLQLWYQAVFEYSYRQLTNPHDIFAAISSIAQLAKRSIRSRYLAGLWEVDIVRGLLWYTYFTISGREIIWPKDAPSVDPRPKRPTKVDGKPAIRAPSWSWASVQGRVRELSRPQSESLYRDPSNFLIQPMPKTKAKPQDTVNSPDYSLDRLTWTAWDTPHCDADVLHMPTCELWFLGRPKPVHCVSWIGLPKSDLTKSHPLCRRMPGTHGFRVLLEAGETEHAGLDELGVIPLRASSTTTPSHDRRDTALPPLVFASACFDVGEEQADNIDCWFLPLIKEKWEGLLLRKDVSDGKFRRLGLAVVIKKQFLPWLLSGPEEEVRLV